VAIPEPISVKHNAQQIGQLITPTKNRSTAKQSNKVCEKCKNHIADGLLGLLCHICQRKLQYEDLPEEEKRKLQIEVVPERYINAEISHLSKGLQKAVEADTNTGILLWGAAGVGKTYALSALARKHIADGYIVKRIHYEVLCLKLRDTFNPKATQTEWSIIEPLLNCDKLYIEDVGTSKSIGNQESDFSLRTFLVLLDMRMECCRPTFITSNKSVENLADSFDQRVGDRLKTFLVIKLGGESKRKCTKQ
jgi:DNA replication protein DnaC